MRNKMIMRMIQKLEEAKLNRMRVQNIEFVIDCLKVEISHNNISGRLRNEGKVKIKGRKDAK